MSEKKTELKNFEDIAKFLQNLEEWEKLYFVVFNEYVLKYLKEHQIKSINPTGCSGTESEAFAGDNSLRFFLRRAVYYFIKDNAGDLKASLAEDNEFCFASDFSFACLDTDTTKAIFNACKKKEDGIFQSEEQISNDVLDLIVKLCECTRKKDNNDKNKIFPLDFIIYSVNKRNWAKDSEIGAIFPFIDMSNFCYDNQKLPDADIYKFFSKIPLDCFNLFLNNKQFVKKLGGIGHLKKLLSSDNENAQNLAERLHDRCQKIDFETIESDEETGMKIVDDKDYKAKVKRAFIIHQLPKSVASAIVFLY